MLFRGKFVERCTDRPTEMKGVPTLQDRKEAFPGETEGDGWRGRAEEGTSFQYWWLLLREGPLRSSGPNPGSWFSSLCLTDTHAFSTLFVVL